MPGFALRPPKSATTFGHSSTCDFWPTAEHFLAWSPCTCGLERSAERHRGVLGFVSGDDLTDSDDLGRKMVRQVAAWPAEQMPRSSSRSSRAKRLASSSMTTRTPLPSMRDTQQQGADLALPSSFSKEGSGLTKCRGKWRSTPCPSVVSRNSNQFATSARGFTQSSWSPL